MPWLRQLNITLYLTSTDASRQLSQETTIHNLIFRAENTILELHQISLLNVGHFCLLHILRLEAQRLLCVSLFFVSMFSFRPRPQPGVFIGQKCDLFPPCGRISVTNTDPQV